MTKETKQTKSTKPAKITISDEYFQYMDKYQAKYGKKTIVIMQVGSFHEIYSCSIRKKNPEIYQIADILNLVVSRKDKSEPISESNHLMCGWPCVATTKFIKLLIDNNFTVVVIDQTTPPPNPLREVTGVYSPSTYIDNQTHENKYLMALYIEINASLNTAKPNISIGMCAVDSSTGDVSYYETHASGLSEEALQETQRFYHYYRPVELIVYQIDNTSIKTKTTGNSDSNSNPNSRF